MRPDISCDIQLLGSEFDVSNMTAWIHLAFYQIASLVYSRQICYTCVILSCQHVTRSLNTLLKTYHQ